MEWYIIILLILLLLICLFNFLIAPCSIKKAYDFKWLFERPIAHRGYHKNDNVVPENSKIAFLRAIENNYNIEIDLNLTKDHKVVVFHDGTLNRMCNVNKRVYELTLEELQKLPLKDSEYFMMEFEEFLNLVNNQVGILIEFKSEGKIINQILCEESMKILKKYQGRYVIQSFQPGILKWFKKNYPDVPRGQLSHNFIKKGEKDAHPYIVRWLFTYAFSNFIGRPHFMSRQHDSINVMIKYLKKRKTPLLVWTVNNKEIYQKVAKTADNVIFEHLRFDENGKLI